MQKEFVNLGVELTFKTPMFRKLYTMFWGDGFHFAGVNNPFFENCLIHVRPIEKGHICPFCGKEVQGLKCDCESFTKYFEVLQMQIKADNNDDDDSPLDIKRTMFLDLRSPDNVGVINVKLYNGPAIGGIQVDQVLRGKIRCKGHRKSYVVNIINTTYDGKTLKFFLSFDKENVMYEATAEVPYTPSEIEIGRWGFVFVSQEDTRDTIEMEIPWYGHKKYTSWEDLCKTLLQLAAEEQ